MLRQYKPNRSCDCTMQFSFKYLEFILQPAEWNTEISKLFGRLIWNTFGILTIILFKTALNYLFIYLAIFHVVFWPYIYKKNILTSWCGCRPEMCQLPIYIFAVSSLLSHAVMCFFFINLFDLVYISPFFMISWQQAFWHLVASVSFRQKLFFRQSWLVSIFQSVEMLMLFRFQ